MTFGRIRCRRSLLNFLFSRRVTKKSQVRPDNFSDVLQTDVDGANTFGPIFEPILPSIGGEAAENRSTQEMSDAPESALQKESSASSLACDVELPELFQDGCCLRLAPCLPRQDVSLASSPCAHALDGFAEEKWHRGHGFDEREDDEHRGQTHNKDAGCIGKALALPKEPHREMAKVDLYALTIFIRHWHEVFGTMSVQKPVAEILLAFLRGPLKVRKREYRERIRDPLRLERSRKERARRIACFHRGYRMPRRLLTYAQDPREYDLWIEVGNVFAPYSLDENGERPTIESIRSNASTGSLTDSEVSTGSLGDLRKQLGSFVVNA